MICTQQCIFSEINSPENETKMSCKEHVKRCMHVVTVLMQNVGTRTFPNMHVPTLSEQEIPHIERKWPSYFPELHFSITGR